MVLEHAAALQITRFHREADMLHCFVSFFTVRLPDIFFSTEHISKRDNANPTLPLSPVCCGMSAAAFHCCILGLMGKHFHTWRFGRENTKTTAQVTLCLTESVKVETSPRMQNKPFLKKVRERKLRYCLRGGHQARCFSHRGKCHSTPPRLPLIPPSIKPIYPSNPPPPPTR